MIRRGDEGEETKDGSHGGQEMQAACPRAQQFQFGQGQPEDAAPIEELAEAMRLTSICGLGQVAPAPFTSALQHFSGEIMAHVKEKRCPAGVCPLD